MNNAAACHTERSPIPAPPCESASAGRFLSAIHPGRLSAVAATSPPCGLLGVAFRAYGVGTPATVPGVKKAEVKPFEVDERRTVMIRCSLPAGTVMLLTCVLLGNPLVRPVRAEPPRKKRVEKKPASPKKARAVRSPSSGSAAASDARRTQKRKSYVRPRKAYGHVRVARHHRRDDGRLDIRPIMARSARVRPVVLNRFEERHRGQVHLMIQHVKDGHRKKALDLWGLFVEGLADYHEPIDLDEIMLLIARDGCHIEDESILFHAAKLDFLRESQERLEAYISLMDDRRDACLRGLRRCTSETIRNIEKELVRAGADRRILDIEERVERDEFDARAGAQQEYERRFAATYEDLYREVEFRIRFSP